MVMCIVPIAERPPRINLSLFNAPLIKNSIVNAAVPKAKLLLLGYVKYWLLPLKFPEYEDVDAEPMEVNGK